MKIKDKRAVYKRAADKSTAGRKKMLDDGNCGAAGHCSFEYERVCRPVEAGRYRLVVSE